MSNFITWDDSHGSKESAFGQYNDVVDSFTGVYKEGLYSTRANRTFENIDQNRSVRPGFNRSDYESMREDSAVPSDKRKSIQMCTKAYKNVGMIRNIIDLMGDFACQGINLVHRDKGPESLCQQWWKKINGKERTERALNLLYRTGNVVMYRSYADITPGLKEYMKSLASDVKVDVPKVQKGRIPFKYTFFNPLSLDIKNGDLHLNATSNTKMVNGFSFNQMGRTSQIPKEVLESLPQTLRTQILQNKKQIKLDKERLITMHYKKDDWEQWADPLIHAILDDVMMLEKMRLADLSALDGAISNIRLWTLGSLDHKIIPNKAAIDRLRNILTSNQGGGTMELVWGPELSFTESSTDVHKFLGSEKYASVLNAIYAGLGVPPTLTGQAGNGGGFTNNFISLKTLVERLQYGRELVVRMWEHELELFRQAMGLRYAPEIVFDQMSLSDEAAEKALLIQLADRDIISHETLLERFKETPKVEKVRLQREIADREDSKNPDKAGPFHNPDHPKDLEKMDKQFQYDSKKMDKQQKFDKENNKMETKQPGSPKGASKPTGRPKNSKDSAPRKNRQAKPKSKPGVAELIEWTDSAWDHVSDLITEATLNVLNKKNLRQLTKAEFKQLEKVKLDIFTNLEPLSSIDNRYISSVASSNLQAPSGFTEMLQNAGVSLDYMPVDQYRKHVVSNYVQYLL